MKTGIKIMTIFFVGLALCHAVQADELLVPSQYPTIQAAIDDCNNGDTVIIAPAIYTGEGNRDIDFKGKAITVRSIDPNDPNIVAATVIDCNGSEEEHHRGFYFNSNEGSNSVLAGLTITNGYADEGGGIYCYWDSSPTITNCTITGNIADEGGGIYCRHDSDPRITNCTITGNIASNYGGAIHCLYDSDPRIANCTITGNQANYGGAIFCNDSCPTIANCTIEGNIATKGGGICGSNGNITNCIISENISDMGGGIYLFLGGDPRITSCTIVGNIADEGGGIYCGGSNVRIANCTIMANIAFQNGGGIHCYYSNSRIINCTITGNTADEGGGIFGFGSSPMITNCTIAGNVAQIQAGGISCGFGIPLLTNCILWTNADSNGTGLSAQIYSYEQEVTFSCIQDDNPDDANIPFGGADNNNIDDNPMFVRDPNDGGDGWYDNPQTPNINEAANNDFGDLHLQSGSPCINAGDPSTWAGPDSVDMDGQWRIMGHIIDMGADEFLIPIIITTRPQGGEVWVSGSQHKIMWDSCANIETVDILFSKDAGGNWQTIESNIPDSGGFKCQMPDIFDSNQCLILVVPNIPDPNVSCIESGLFTVHPDSPGPAVQSKWKSLGGDFDRAGLSQDSGPDLGCVKWQFQTDGPVTASAAVGADGKIAIACEDGKLYTLDANGTLLWSYDTNSPLLSSPSIGPDGTIYIGAKNGKLYAIDTNGHLRWTHSTGAWIYSSPAVSENGKVFVGSQDGTLYALNQDGSELWSFQTYGAGNLSGAILASPAIGPDGTIYTAGLYDPNLYALNPNDGSIKWVCNFPLQINPYNPHSDLKSGWPFASPVIASDGTIYQTLIYVTYLYAIEPNEGDIIWSTNLADPSSGWFDPNYIYRYRNADNWSEPTLGPDGTIYVSFDDPYLRALDPNGSIKWITRLGMVGGFTLTIGNDGLIYAAGDDAHLYVVDTNGSEIARFRSDEWLSFPVIAADNTIIVSDANNIIWALGSEGCEAKSSALHIPGDLNTDWIVNFRDFALLALDWLDCTDREILWPRYHSAPPCDYYNEIYLEGDINRNLYVDIYDLAEMANQWLN